MNIDAAFPSNYLKASDLQGREVKVTMARVAMEDIGSDHKPVLYFEGKDRGLVLNITNKNNIKAMFGADTDEWKGKQVTLFATTTDFQGRTVECIRVKGTAQPKPQLKELIDDEIPF